ncbi:MAG: hypothetical protein SOU51_03510 [Collinsella sp.]|nr:hypothetical protein [Collinsella sp.]
MQDFMKGRYGVDDLTIALGGIGMVLALIGTLAKLGLLSWIALAAVLVALARAFSTNIPARQAENISYLKLVAKMPVVGQHFGAVLRERERGTSASTRVQRPGRTDVDRAKRTAERMWRERKTSLFFRCKTCGTILSVPRGKGKLRVTCPKCGTKVEKQS